MSQKINTFSLR